MYKITTPEGAVFTTEKPNFIRVHSNGCYILCDRSKAEGVAYGGTPYLFKDGTMCHEIDGGKEVDTLAAKDTELELHLAETDEVAIQLYETSLTQDDAIIEIYEMMEGIING